jgi:hypothetical protein
MKLSKFEKYPFSILYSPFSFLYSLFSILHFLFSILFSLFSFLFSRSIKSHPFLAFQLPCIVGPNDIQIWFLNSFTTSTNPRTETSFDSRSLAWTQFHEYQHNPQHIQHPQGHIHEAAQSSREDCNNTESWLQSHPWIRNNDDLLTQAKEMKSRELWKDIEIIRMIPMTPMTPISFNLSHSSNRVPIRHRDGTNEQCHWKCDQWSRKIRCYIWSDQRNGHKNGFNDRNTEKSIEECQKSEKLHFESNDLFLKTVISWRDEMQWDEMRWDEMRWDEMRKNAHIDSSTKVMIQTIDDWWLHHVLNFSWIFSRFTNLKMSFQTNHHLCSAHNGSTEMSSEVNKSRYDWQSDEWNEIVMWFLQWFDDRLCDRWMRAGRSLFRLLNTLDCSCLTQSRWLCHVHVLQHRKTDEITIWSVVINNVIPMISNISPK